MNWLLVYINLMFFKTDNSHTTLCIVTGLWWSSCKCWDVTIKGSHKRVWSPCCALSDCQNVVNIQLQLFNHTLYFIFISASLKADNFPILYNNIDFFSSKSMNRYDWATSPNLPLSFPAEILVTSELVIWSVSPGFPVFSILVLFKDSYSHCLFPPPFPPFLPSSRISKPLLCPLYSARSRGRSQEHMHTHAPTRDIHTLRVLKHLESISGDKT